MSSLNWPDGLTDLTPLPFRVWQVMHHVDGQRLPGEVAVLAQVTVQDVLARHEEALRWLEQARRREQRVAEPMALEVKQCLAAAVGPVAALMVDEVLDDLGQDATLSALLASLASQLSHDRAQLFARHLRDRGMA